MLFLFSTRCDEQDRAGLINWLATELLNEIVNYYNFPALTDGAVKKRSTWALVSVCPSVCLLVFAYNMCTYRAVLVLGERDVFFHPEGPQAGVGWGGALGRRTMGRAVSAELSAL